MLPLLASLPALALPASGDLQVRLHAPTLAFAEAEAEALDPFVSDEDLFEEDVDCWDRVGVADFNLSVPIDAVSLEADQGVFRVEVAFGDLLGTNWTVYSVDEDYLDTCPEFEVEVDRFAVLDGTFTGALEPVVDGDGVSFRWVGTPTIEGDFDTDISWVPDDLILFFVEDLVFAQAAAAVEAALPPVVEEALAEPLLSGEYGGYDVTMALEDAEVVGSGLAFGATTDVAFVGTPSCSVPSGGEAPGGRSPELDLAQVGDSHLTVGLTEAFANQLFFAAWESGAFCYEPETFQDLADKLDPIVDPDVTGLTGLASLDAPAELRFTADGARLALTGQRLQIQGYRNGNTVTVVDAVLDLDGRLRFGFAPSLTALTVTLHDLDIDFRQVRLDGGLGGFGDRVRTLVQEWLANALEDELKRIPVFDSLFYAAGIAIQVEDVSSEEGGVAIALRLYAEDDPAIDRVAPDTTATLVQAGKRRAEIAWDGTDDRDAALAWAWQLDGQGWSDWTNETSVVVDDLAEGQHVFTVKARDAWLNEDPSPARVTFQTSASNPALGCGCGTLGAVPALPLALLPLLVLARRRDHEGAPQ
jgi:uncharacterized protein (TIGR03382 family)